MQALAKRVGLVALFLVAMTVGWALQGAPARAGMVSTETLLEAQAGASEVRARLRSLPAREGLREELRAQFEALGIAPEEAVERIESLSDAEIAVIAGKLDALPAGGAGPLEWVLAVLIVLLLVIILI